MHLEGQAAYKTFSQLRNLLLQLVTGLSRSAQERSGALEEFEHYLLAAHYLALFSVCTKVKSLGPLSAKLSIALLRYTDVVPADRAFYIAGSRAKVPAYVPAKVCMCIGTYVRIYVSSSVVLGVGLPY